MKADVVITSFFFVAAEVFFLGIDICQKGVAPFNLDPSVEVPGDFFSETVRSFADLVHSFSGHGRSPLRLGKFPGFIEELFDLLGNSFGPFRNSDRTEEGHREEIVPLFVVG